MRRQLRALRIRFNGWPRRALAICCLLGALGSVLHHRRASASASVVAVVVAAHDLAIGTTISAGDVRLAHWSPADAPPGAMAATRTAVGRRLSTPLARGEPVTRTRVVGSGLTAGLSGDEVASSVDTATDQSALIHPGDHIDLVAAPSDDQLAAASGAQASVVARDATVLAILPHTDRDAGAGSTLIVATSRSSALVLAAVNGSRILAVLGRSP